MLFRGKCSNCEIASNVGSGTNKFLEELKANERENFRMVGEKVRNMSIVFPINNLENESCTSCQVIKAVSHDAMSEPAAFLSEKKLKRIPLKLVCLLLTTVVNCCHFSQVKELGGVPLMTKISDMSCTIPDEKVAEELCESLN